MATKSNIREAEEKFNRDGSERRRTQAPAGGPGVSPMRARSGAQFGEARAPAPLAPRSDPESDEDSQPRGRAEPEQEAANRAADPRAAGSRRNRFLLVVGAILAIVLAIGGYVYWDYAQAYESTADAFIASRPFAVAPRVSGYITAVPVTDNQHVAADAVIAQIDERDYRTALDQAQAQVAAAAASIENIDAQISVQQAQVAANQAQVDQAQAALVFARQQAERYEDLARRGAGTVQNAQQFSSSLEQQEAALRNARATLAAAQQQIDSLKAQRANADATLAQANAQRDQAQLNLSYTTVRAAQGGRVVNLTAAVGEFAQAGTNLAMFVPDQIWVTANFKETQLAEMRPGQPVTLHIDAYPDRTIYGHVESVQPGSGTAFSLLPAENATGNYVKIVQRVPVKLVVDDLPADVAIGPGMSVVPTVQVRNRASVYDRLAAFVRHPASVFDGLASLYQRLATRK